MPGPRLSWRLAAEVRDGFFFFYIGLSTVVEINENIMFLFVNHGHRQSHRRLAPAANELRRQEALPREQGVDGTADSRGAIVVMSLVVEKLSRMLEKSRTAGFLHWRSGLKRKAQGKRRGEFFLLPFESRDREFGHQPPLTSVGGKTPFPPPLSSRLTFLYFLLLWGS